MADRSKRRDTDANQASPAGREAREQGRSGTAAGPRAAKSGEGGRQPPQGSRRTDTTRQARESARFEPGHAPSEQGRGSPKPDTIAQHQRGMKAASGNRGAHTVDVTEQAMRGEPRRGRKAEPGRRQNLPADRPEE
jgi:hypothetical protein